MLRRWVGLLLVATMAIAAMPLDGRADEAPPSEEAALKRKARELLREGNRLASQGDFGAALPKFNAAYELYPSPKLLLNIGTSLRHTGRYAAAAEVYEQYLRDPDAEAAEEKEVRRVLGELDDLVGWLEIRLAEPGLRVSVDGRLLGDAGRQVRLRVDPGPHTVVAEKAGREPAVRHVTVAAQQTEEIAVVMTDEDEPPPEPVPIRPLVGYGLAGLGAATVVVGAIVGGVALSTTADAEAQCADEGDFAGFCTEEGVDLAAEARSQGTAAAITLAAGALAVAIGLGVAWTGDEEEQEPSVAVWLVPGESPLLRGTLRW